MNINEMMNAYWLAIDGRCDVDSKTASKIKNIKVGLEGESLFEKHLKAVDRIVYGRNLYFNQMHPLEIDFLVINGKQAMIFEVKHYSGDYKYDGDALESAKGFRFAAPHVQLLKQVNELKMVLKRAGLSMSVSAYVVYTNPTFTLSGGIPHRGFTLLPTELHKIPTLFPQRFTSKDQIILDKIRTQQIDLTHRLNFEKPYGLDQARTGLRCSCCKEIGFIEPVPHKKTVRCTRCGSNFIKRDVYYEHLKELYCIKNDGFTLKEAMAWCEGASFNTVRRISNDFFIYKGVRNKKYFI
ncbi:NERD domain-containing protein [Staphylococcus massiliensis]|uniref:nuclease-related domain-containing protein n=1 Tax=Staphylococcus massiliensis TaxID=555791 RepID=UPI001EDF2F03|nr:nuclease-related domain-containing protein [Staphylococcus massiliensis]MCG3411668.1 NERD domain-containing protein [Staphylococcus massiliensis]